MYEFIRIQYLLKKLSAEQVKSFAPKWITAEEAERIIATERSDDNVQTS